MEDTSKKKAEAWTKEVAGFSKATAEFLNAAAKVREARNALEILKVNKAKAAADDPDYIINDPAALDETISDLADLEATLCTQALGNMEAHKDTDDDLA